MNPRTKLLAELAALGVVVMLVVTFAGGGPQVVKPLRTASGGGNRSPSPGTSPAGNPRSGYEAFRFFQTRNVFDPDRRPLRAVASETPAPAASPARTDFVALTGVLLQPDRSLAFFSGSRAEYNQVLAVRDHVAGAEITQILPASIEIDRAGQKTQVGVGQTVPLSNGLAPGLAPAPDAYASAPATGSSAAVGRTGPGNTASASPGSPSSSKQDEIRRRLEERRRQEQK